MNREQVLERIMDPHGPPMNEAERLEFEQWLDQEPELRSMFEQQQALFEAMDSWESPEPSATFDQAVYARIERDQAVEPYWRRMLFASWKPALAAGVAAAALLLGVFVSQDKPPQDPAQVAIKAAPDAEYYEEIDRALDDMEMLIDFDAFPQPPAPGRS